MVKAASSVPAPQAAVGSGLVAGRADTLRGWTTKSRGGSPSIGSRRGTPAISKRCSATSPTTWYSAPLGAPRPHASAGRRFRYWADGLRRVPELHSRSNRSSGCADAGHQLAEPGRRPGPGVLPASCSEGTYHRAVMPGTEMSTPPAHRIRDAFQRPVRLAGLASGNRAFFQRQYSTGPLNQWPRGHRIRRFPTARPLTSSGTVFHRQPAPDRTALVHIGRTVKEHRAGTHR